MYLFNNLNQIVQTYLSEDQIKCLQKTYSFACNAHKGQMRLSGEPYIIHPVAVACILAEMKLDYETLMAALLHDVIEDTSITYYDMKQLFGKDVAKLVEGVSKLDKFKYQDKNEIQAENFRKMIIAMMQDIRVILIKLADRTHNMRTLDPLHPDKRRRIAKETLEIYSPIAHRLGMHYIKNELEELGFAVLYPSRYQVVKKVVKAARNNRKDMIQKTILEIEKKLREAGIISRVSSREKHLYSICCKMILQKEQYFHSIMDIYAFHIIVHDLETCYHVLNQVYNLYKQYTKYIKDYIAIPKSNGYQSIHALMISPHGIPVEIQIRTEDMDQTAEMGIVAHWNDKKWSENSNITQIHIHRWIQSLLKLQQSAGNSSEFVKNVKSNLSLDEIYVFTPEGCIIELPIGSTPIDFAYVTHTDISHTYIGARVNRQPYPMSQPLFSGQTVEIITESNIDSNKK